MAGLVPAIPFMGHSRAILSGVTGTSPVTTKLMRNRAGNFSVGRLMEFLIALGQDVKITIRPTRKEQWEMEVVVS
jgi:hypothetical protein